MTVHLITKDATLDDLSASDYRDIFTEIREKMSLDKFVALSGSLYSKAQWGKYEHAADMTPTRAMRNDLRRAVGMAELPPTVADAVGAASPDASVWMVGEGTPETVIMVGSTPVTLHVNGSVSEVVGNAHVTRLHRGTRRLVRPVVSECQKQRFDALRGLKWRDVIDAGLEQYERMAAG
jgi:hypothetical protein